MTIVKKNRIFFQKNTTFRLVWRLQRLKIAKKALFRQKKIFPKTGSG